MIRKNEQTFSGSQEIMYTVMRLAWKHYKRHIEDFQNHSGGFTIAMADDALKAIDAAKALPDVQKRRDNSKASRAEVHKAAKECTRLWQHLARYIEYAFPEDKVAYMKTAAGGYAYVSATGKSWFNVSALGRCARLFIQNFETTLLAGGNGMPATFAARFFEVEARFDNLLMEYIMTKQKTRRGTGDKIDANNKVYKEGRKMMKTAHLIFHENSLTKELFVYTTLASQCGKPKPSPKKQKTKETMSSPTEEETVTVKHISNTN